MNYQDILNRFSYDDETKIINRISKAEREDYRENQDIINEIVLWKLNRRPQISTTAMPLSYLFGFCSIYKVSGTIKFQD